MNADTPITDSELATLKATDSEQQWNMVCDAIVASRGSYPPDWYQRVVASGLAKRVAAKWGGTDEIRVTIS